MTELEELFEIQKERAEWIKKIGEKYTKEPILRRTKEFVRERLADLEYQWTEFKETDNKIKAHPNCTNRQPYTESNFYAAVKSTVDNLRQKLETKLDEILEEEQKRLKEEKKRQMTTQGASDELNTTIRKEKDNQDQEGELSGEQDKRIRRQEAQIQAFIRSVGRVEQNGQGTKAYYQHSQQVLQNQWETITKTHSDIVELTETTSSERYVKICTEYEQLEEKYNEIMVNVKEKINEMISQNSTHQEAISDTTTNHELKLPTLKLMTFNGDYRQWKSFNDLFEQAIHNNGKLGNAQKMHYLKTNITGEAAKIIQHLQILDCNYDKAREILRNRYENTRLLVNAQIQALLNQKDSQIESATHLRRLHDTTTECINALKGLSLETGSWDPIIVFILSQKLDNETRKAYEQSLKDPKALQSLNEFLTFIENKFHALDNLEGRRNKTEYQKDERHMQKANGVVTRKNVYKNYHSTSNPCCKLCNEEHRLQTCRRFIQMPILQRKDVVLTEKLCHNCLGGNHVTANCQSRKACQKCQQRHHTLLHSNETTNQREQQQSHFASGMECNKILLATAVIKTNWKGCDHYLRALIDQGSQSSFITEDAVQRLQLQKIRADASITGLGTAKAATATSKIELNISSIYPSDFKIWGTLLVLNKLTKPLPDESFTVRGWDHVKHLPLADPSFNKKTSVDVLIGADIFQEIILEGVVKGDVGTPVAQNTQLGWILSGSCQHKRNEATLCHVSNVELNNQLKSFWETEEVQEERATTEDNMRCEEYYKTTHKRDKTGRYTVRIPFKNDTGKLGKSKDRALARLLQLEKKFTRDTELHKNYTKFMKEYLELGHMEPVKSTSNNEIVYYMPHQAVIKPDSTTTKTRVVFDASSRTSSGLSLNDTMLTGPVLQQDLYSILSRWRKHKYVYRADIEKMYRQIKIAEEDRDFQRILWREEPSKQIQEYRLTTVTYGTSSAPYLAIKTLQQLAVDEENNLKTASKIAQRDFYVDDLLSGEDTLEEARRAQHQIIQLMQKGGFKLRKWSSNRTTLLRDIKREDQEQGIYEVTACEAIKTLGIYWRPDSDTFEFKINMNPSTKNLTKRIIISEMARLFDPLGWLAPIIITAKLIQQELWLSGKSWDENLPDDISKRWMNFKENLYNIESISIPRWNQYETKYRIELHGFCDASEKAYAAAVYSRVITKTGEVLTTLLCAKTKAAPIKQITLPRLELNGAVLLAKLIKKAKKALQIENIETHAWSDSTINLAWIKGGPTKWKNFVANRVTEITAILSAENWHHVKGTENPADCASRGICPSKLKGHALWWNGPKWLSKLEITYTDTEQQYTDLEERKVKTQTLTTLNEQEPDRIKGMLAQYSTLRRLTRVLAYCKRFIHNARTSEDGKRLGPLTCDEIWSATKNIIKKVQDEEFSKEIRHLKRGKEIEKKSKLRCLNAFMDKDDMLRVGGRLTEADIPPTQKHPFIIPHSGPLTTMLIEDAHKTTLHGGNTLTQAHLRQRYWIINGASAVKQSIHRCAICFRFKSKISNQLMGNLPQPRVTNNRPFLHTGVDYAGPIDIRMTKGRGNKSYKGYIAIFVCLATKAVHIEAVSDLTANAFVSAFKRVCARRGHIGHLYSDNGTNFVAANKILQLNVKDAKKWNEEIYDTLASNHTEWHFIPPGSPHFGGLWEAGVKSIKHHLKRTIGEHKLTYEELSTLLTQIEACLNSRPICPLSNDPEETEVITPGHFLIGTALLAPPERCMLDSEKGLLTRWHLLERMQQQFWKKWSTEYLATLQQRSKWTKTVGNLKVGNIVLIKDEQLPPTKWKLAKVVETHAGTDGLVRVVTVETHNKTYKRPVTKICLLPITDNDEFTNLDRKTKEIMQTPATKVKPSTNRIETLKNIPKTVSSHHIQVTVEEYRSTKRNKIRPTNIPSRPPIEELIGRHQERKRPHESNKQHDSRIKRVALPSLLLSIALVIVALPHQGSTQITTTPFKHRPGIYFEKIGNVNLVTNEWKILVYYDLGNYWREYRGFKELINGLNDFCKRKNTDGFKKYTQCIKIANQFDHQLSIIKNNNNLLLKQGVGKEPEARAKRSPFDFVGMVANKLFGVLDEDFAQQYENQIQSFKENEKHLLGMVKNQTSIIESTKNILQKDTEVITQQLEIFHTHLENLANDVLAANEDCNAKVEFLSLSTFATLAMLNYQQAQNALIDVLIDIHHGKMNPLILTPDQLHSQLTTIRNHLPPQLAIAGDASQPNLLQFFKLLTVKGRVMQQNVVFEITIPLANIEDYEIFKVIPVPTVHQKEYIFIEPSADYLVVNLLREAYYTITKDELIRCIQNNDKYICHQQHPTYNRRSNISRCEMELLTHADEISPFCTLRSMEPHPVWIQLNNANKWIYVLEKEYTINIICGQKIFETTLKDDGILTIEPNCIVKQDTMTILSKNKISSRVNTSFIPSVNISHILLNTTRNKANIIPRMSLKIDHDNLNAVSQWIEDLKKHEQLPGNTTPHDIHHNITYAVMLVFAVSTIGYIVWRRRRKISAEEQQETEAQPQPARRHLTVADFSV